MFVLLMYYLKTQPVYKKERAHVSVGGARHSIKVEHGLGRTLISQAPCASAVFSIHMLLVTSSVAKCSFAEVFGGIPNTTELRV